MNFGISVVIQQCHFNYEKNYEIKSMPNKVLLQIFSNFNFIESLRSRKCVLVLLHHDMFYIFPVCSKLNYCLCRRQSLPCSGVS